MLHINSNIAPVNNPNIEVYSIRISYNKHYSSLSDSKQKTYTLNDWEGLFKVNIKFIKNDVRYKTTIYRIEPICNARINDIKSSIKERIESIESYLELKEYRDEINTYFMNI